MLLIKTVQSIKTLWHLQCNGSPAVQSQVDCPAVRITFVTRCDVQNGREDQAERGHSAADGLCFQLTLVRTPFMLMQSLADFVGFIDINIPF